MPGGMPLFLPMSKRRSFLRDLAGLIGSPPVGPGDAALYLFAGVVLGMTARLLWEAFR